MSTFGERLSAELRDTGWTQSEFAKAVGTYPCNMSQWINGTVSPTARSLRKILEMLPGTDARWLLTGGT